MCTVLLPPGDNPMCTVLLPPGDNPMCTVLLPPGDNPMCIVLLPPGVNPMCTVLLPPGVNPMCTVMLPPGDNPMCTVLLPPGVNPVAVKCVSYYRSERIKSAAYMAYSFIKFFYILLIPFLSDCVYTNSCMFCMLLSNFVNYAFLFLYILIVIIMYFYVRIVLCILFHCAVLCIVCVQMCTVLLPPGVNPISYIISYHIISYII
jgi:hypothetical protein